jgi:putative redox protein
MRRARDRMNSFLHVTPPYPTTVSATWSGDHRFNVRGAKGESLTIDIGKVEGTGPVDTLLGALAACSADDVLGILAKRRTPVEKLEIVVTGERRGDAPKRLLSVHLEFRVTGAGIEAVHAERAIALSIEKYCSVASSLAPDIAISSALVLEGTAHTVRAHAVDRPVAL